MQARGRAPARGHEVRVVRGGAESMVGAGSLHTAVEDVILYGSTQSDVRQPD